MGVYIKDETGLKRIDGSSSGSDSGVSSEALSKHENNHYIHMQEDDTGELNIVDDNGNIIAKVDAEGLNAKNVKVDGKTVSDMIAEAVEGIEGGGGLTEEEVGAIVDEKLEGSEVTKESIGLGNVDNTADKDKPVSTAQQTALNNLQETMSEQIDSDSDVFHVVDSSGNIVATIDAEGVHTTEVVLPSGKLSEILANSGITRKALKVRDSDDYADVVEYDGTSEVVIDQIYKAMADENGNEFSYSYARSDVAQTISGKYTFDKIADFKQGASVAECLYINNIMPNDYQDGNIDIFTEGGNVTISSTDQEGELAGNVDIEAKYFGIDANRIIMTVPDNQDAKQITISGRSSTMYLEASDYDVSMRQGFKMYSQSSDDPAISIDEDENIVVKERLGVTLPSNSISIVPKKYSMIITAVVLIGKDCKTSTLYLPPMSWFNTKQTYEYSHFIYGSPITSDGSVQLVYKGYSSSSFLGTLVVCNSSLETTTNGTIVALNARKSVADIET